MENWHEWQRFNNKLSFLCIALLILFFVLSLFGEKKETELSKNNIKIFVIVKEIESNKPCNDSEKSDYEIYSEERQTQKSKGITEEQFEILCRIVEAEAGGEKYFGKKLVSNVILNRVESDDFPNTIEDVVFERIQGTDYYQFSPIHDGRYWKVDITETTKQAVEEVINSDTSITDALYFQSSSLAKKGSWQHDNLDLVILFEGHAFYK